MGFLILDTFNKHFKLHYKLTPLQFRKKYKSTPEVLEKLTKYITHPLEESLDDVIYYLEDYDRFNYEDKIHQLNINMENYIGEFDKNFNRVITIGDAFDLLIEDNKDTLEELQGEMDFEYGRILNLFSTDMAIFPGSKFHNWNRAKDVLEFIEFLDIIPILVLDIDSTYEEHINNINDESNEGDTKNILSLKNSIDIYEDFKNILLSFMEYFSAIETLNYKNFRFQFSSTFPENLRTSIEEILIDNKLEFEEEPFTINNEVNNIYDTAYMIPFIIDNVVNHQGDLSFIRAFDCP